MQTGYILVFCIFPIFSEGCCVGNRPDKRSGRKPDAAHQHYRAVEGEMFVMPCSESVCSRTAGGAEGTSFVCGSEFPAEARHSGKYTCSGSELFFHLQVVKRSEISLGCFHPEENSVELRVDAGGEVPCPGLKCSNNTHVIWYKGNKAVSEQNRSSCQTSGSLKLCQVSKHDTGVYFCDQQIIERGVIWTFRRAVHVTVVPDKASYPPRFKKPYGNTTETVQLGGPHNLTCEVYFPFEVNFSREVLWYMNHGSNMENMTLLPMEKQQQVRVTFNEYKVIRSAIIEQVTPQHLNYRYTCIASNIVGNRRGTVELKNQIKVKWPSLVGYPIASLLLVAGLGIVLHVKWLEIQLIYRSHFQHGKHHGEEKEFDVFLSYVWSPPPSAGVEGVSSLSSPRGPDTDEEACLSRMDLLNTEEGGSTQRPLEVVLPQVLEDRWGYRLCLLERDVVPGGAYTNDVVLAIQRSRMLICLLSADYLSNSNAVFVLESGIQALLQNSAVKLLLIWTSRASASLIQPDSPLPTLVQRALKVLPSLDWTSGKPATTTSNFWRSLRKAMPDQRVKRVSLTQNQKHLILP
ncbi:interleukin-18 receptor accessory protein-like isoform X2 [Cyclopterus lumpus]|uniref:interleukin-18 receptor accessory protein-like isoform X2 n=1 Tax=Cyclopterus lumpus TaxID=8103 RepID=UPI00148603F8|nr:interleukin-18 receptor accessory protein-like isoform X2 [Cyclopterus lumpus]